MQRTVHVGTLLALTLLTMGLFAQAPATPAPSGNPADKGWAAYKAGDIAAAMTEARAALKTASGDPQVLELYGRCSLALAEPSSAAGALNLLTSRRGTLSDFVLQAAALEMTGKFAEARAALDKAEKGKEPTAEGLYALACRKGDAQGRAALLKRIASDFPSTAAGLAPEIAFWESKGTAKFRETSAVPATGASLDLKTLYNMEWATCKAPGGEDLWLMVDTAARESILSKDAAERMKLTVVKASMPVAAGPQAKDVGFSIIDKLDFGTFQVSNVPVLVVEDPGGTLLYREGRAVLKGVLGMDLLRGMKVRLDRQKNFLRLFPADAPVSALLDGDPSAWKDAPAFSLRDQVMVRSAIGTRGVALGLLSTGCSLVLVPEGTLTGTGLKPDSKNTVDLTASGELQMDPTTKSGDFFNTGQGGMGHSSVGQTRKQTLGWLDEAYPMVGKVRTVPKASEVGFGGGKFQINDIPVYPSPVGDPVPASVIIGKKITDFFALALDLGSGKVYYKQVLFAK
jgi:hypothetical protein